MRYVRALAAAFLICSAITRALSAEGTSIAGPIGGTDLRAAQLPPPGVYGGLILVDATANGFVDGNGKPIAALRGVDLLRERVAPLLVYVPDLKVLGGSVAIAGVFPAGIECGRIFDTTAKRCISGIGDPYLEAAWSRSFGTLRPSKYAGALPILEGLTLTVALGAVLPVGRYSAFDASTQGLTIGNNVTDVAPSVAFTYTTPPILAEGTEVSAKLYLDNYFENPATRYSTGTLIDLDFAVSEHIGAFQVGGAGFYVFQIANDKSFGVALPPDGRQLQFLEVGGVLAYDIPRYAASVKIKVLTTAFTVNTVRSSTGVAFSMYKKLY